MSRLKRFFISNLTGCPAHIYCLLCFTFFWIGWWCIPVAFVGMFLAFPLAKYSEKKLDKEKAEQGFW